MLSPKSLSVIWPGGIKDLQAALANLGFHTEVGKITPQWPRLLKPVSVENSLENPGVPDAGKEDLRNEGYAYLKAGSKTVKQRLPQLGLLIADLKLKGSLEETVPILWSTFPDAAMDFILNQAFPAEWAGKSMKIPTDILVEGSVHIGPDTLIGVGSVIEPHVRIGAGVRIGKNCRIGAGSRISDETVIGDDCLLTGMNAIGGSGFGTITYPNSEIQRMRRHVGRVVIGNRVRLGSYVSIDRGVFGDTLIHDDCLFDNHVQVGHNCVIGHNSILCALVGLAGSTVVGDQAVLAGMVGSAGHLRVGNRAVVAAQSGINSDIADGAQVKGYPPRPMPEFLKIQALIGKLPELYDRLKKLEKNEESK